MMRAPSIRRGVAVAVLACGTLGTSACMVDEPDDGQARVEVEVSSRGGSFAEQVARARVQALQEGASDAQLALLDRAEEEGAVSLAIARAALEGFFACLQDAGIGYTDLGTASYGEFPRQLYTVSDGPSGEASLRCYEQEFASIDGLYQTQPATLADIARQVMLRKDDIIVCLREAGISIEDDPTYDELHAALYLGIFGVPRGARGGDAPAGESVDCYSPVGLDPRDV